MSRSESALAWRQRLQRFAASPLSVTQFCIAENVSRTSFYYWKKRLSEPPQHAPSEPPAPPAPPAPPEPSHPSSPDVSFLPLCLVPGGDESIAPPTPIKANGQSVPPTVPPQTCTTIELPGGVRIRVEVPFDFFDSQPDYSREELA